MPFLDAPSKKISISQKLEDQRTKFSMTATHKRIGHDMVYVDSSSWDDVIPW